MSAVVIQPVDDVSAEPEFEPHPWWPVSLLEAGGEPIAKPTAMGGLRYPGPSRTLASGEPGVGKSMVAAAATAEEALAGGTVLYVDFEGVPAMLLERLQAAGLTDAELQTVLYLRPLLQAQPEQIRVMVEQLQPTFVVVDSYDAALAAFGKTTKAEDVRAFDGLVLRPLQAADAPLLIVDHVVKRRDERGVYPIGAQDKLALADVHLGLAVVTPLRRGTTGRLRVRVHKDRFGHLPRSAIFELRSHETTGAISWTIRPDDTSGDTFRPTGFMEKISIYLEHAPGPLSLTNILDAIPGNRDAKIAAVNALTTEEYATEETGPRKARMFTSTRPYREADDAPE